MNLSGVSDLFPFIPPDGGLVAALGGYFDESEREESGAPICVGGVLFKPSGYKKFCRYWQAHVLRLRGRRFKHFHMTDLFAGHAEYEGLSIADRLIVLNHAIDATTKHAYGGIAVYFDRTEFISKAPRDWPDVYGSIYTVACHMCLQTTAFWLRNWKCDMRVLYVFERGHKFQAEANEFLTAIGKHDESRARFHYKNHVFEDKSAEFGIQAADLFSWAVTKFKVGAVSRSMEAFRTPLLRLANEGGRRFRIHPFTDAILDSFLADNMEGTVVMFKRGNAASRRLPAFR